MHSFKKQDILHKDNKAFNFKKNTFLVGDSVSDRLMTTNMGQEIVLAVGFLNPKDEEKLPIYLEAFDIVLLGEGNFTQVEALFREVVGLPQRMKTKKLLNEIESPLKEFLTLDE
mmetsp:Transcript_20505/g.17896  ORF Transcript_20505/g.17896 Transcript_20505/m.17896 type:complete len:114 (-) Transcript_20505:177-518(-)